MRLVEKGVLIVISGPSGVGKGTVRASIFEQENHNLEYSISMTTRKPRVGEQNGVDYFFVEKEEFLDRIDQGQLLEWAEFVGNYYGTPLDYVNQKLDEGKDVVLEIEVQGALQVKNVKPDACFIFIAPPSMDELRNRIMTRGTEAMDVINKRMQKAEAEIGLAHEYDYIVINDTVENARDRIMAIIEAEHSRSNRDLEYYNKNIVEVE